MKRKIIYGFIIIIVLGLGFFVGCLAFYMKTEFNSTRVPETIASLSPSPSKYSSKLVDVFGKWKVVDRIGYGYSFTDIPEKNYIGGIITITDELVQSSMPDKELNFTVKNPKFVMQWQSRDDFYMEHYTTYDSFGFDNSEKVLKIEIKKKGGSLGFGSTLWIKDENHIIIMGSQYFLAEKQIN